MALKAKIATAAAGLVVVALVPGTAQATDPSYPPTIKAVSCLVGTNSNGNVLKVNMGPNLKGSKNYTFTVQKSTTSGWVDVGTYKTKGSKETRTINLKAGTYQVLCKGKGGYADAVSASQLLLK